MRARIETDFMAVQRSCAALLQDGAAESFFLAPWWWRTMTEAGLPDDASAEFLIVESGAAAVLMLALQRGRTGLAGLSGPYSCLYRPLLARGMSDGEIMAAAEIAAGPLGAAGLCRLEAMDADAPWLMAFEAGLRRSGLRPLRFDHFGTWEENVAGLSWEDYLAARPGVLRETIRRRLRRAAGLAFEIVTGDGLEAGLAAYEDVYGRSWKVPEPFPRFNATMMRNAAAEGTLRLGLLRDGEQTIAAQIWINAGGRAMVAKLAHDEARRRLSPGTVLTARMVQHLLDKERISVLDFGRGDDPYKASWTTRRAQRIGLLLANPWRPSGAMAIGRHLVGRLRRSVSG